MIQRVYEGASKSNRLTDVIVATDDQRIYDAVLAFGGKVEMTDKNHTSGTDRCGEVLSRNSSYDVVINIQGDEPLVSPQQLDELLGAFENQNTQIATLGIEERNKEELHNPNRIKLVKNAKGEAMYFSRSPIPNAHHASESALANYTFLRHIGLYAYRSEILSKLVALEKSDVEKIESLEQLRWMYHGFPIQVVKTEIETPNIDVPADVQKVLAAL